MSSIQNPIDTEPLLKYPFEASPSTKRLNLARQLVAKAQCDIEGAELALGKGRIFDRKEEEPLLLLEETRKKLEAVLQKLALLNC